MKKEILEQLTWRDAKEIVLASMASRYSVAEQIDLGDEFFFNDVLDRLKAKAE